MYIAGHNMCGYLPDSEPQEFEDFKDAKASVIETLQTC